MSDVMTCSCSDDSTRVSNIVRYIIGLVMAGSKSLRTSSIFFSCIVEKCLAGYSKEVSEHEGKNGGHSVAAVYICLDQS